MPWGCASTLQGVKQRWAGCPDSQAKGSAANTAGKALHGSTEHSDPSQALLAAGQKMGPSQWELPTSPGQHKLPMSQRQRRKPEELQGSHRDRGRSGESSESHNHLPRTRQGIGSVAAAFASATSRGRDVKEFQIAAHSTAPSHGPDNANDPGSEGRGERQIKSPAMPQTLAAAGGSAQAACSPPPSLANASLPHAASAHIPASDPQRGDPHPCRA